MQKKIPFVMPLAFLCLLLCGPAGKVFADVSAELEQAKSNIISLIQQRNCAEAQQQTQQWQPVAQSMPSTRLII